MSLAEQLAERAGRTDEDHDACHRLVAELERRGLDRLVLGMPGREFVSITPDMDNGGPRRPLIIQPKKVEPRGWVGPIPWSPKRWREGRSKLRGEG